jgi:hypothetical protein
MREAGVDIKSINPALFLCRVDELKVFPRVVLRLYQSLLLYTKVSSSFKMRAP